MKLIISKVTLLMLLIISFAGSAGPVDLTGRNPFGPGDTLTAIDLNADFNRLRAAIDSNAADIAALPAVTTYNYQDYIEDSATITSKTFSGEESDAIPLCTSPSWTFVYGTSGGNQTVTETQTGCGNNSLVNYYLSNGTQYIWTREDVATPTDSFQWTLGSAGIPVLNSTMKIGDTWSDTVFATGLDATGMPIKAYYLQKSTLLDTESLTLNVNTFSVTYDNCLKIYTVRNNAGTRKGESSLRRLSWFCPGVGEVKRSEVVETNVSGNSNRIIVLTGMS